MANHGYVIRHKECSEDGLDALIKEFLQDERWDGFTASRGDNYWEITHPEHSGYVGIHFGSFYEDGEVIELEGGGVIEKEEPAIELRHGGPRGNLMWYIDFSLQDFLADRLEGKTADDGHDEIHDPEPNKHPDFDSFLSSMRMW